MEKKGQVKINDCNKDRKKTSNTRIVYCKEVPEIYGNLFLFCFLHGINYSTYVKKGFPFELNGYAVHKVEPINGTIDSYILNMIKDHLIVIKSKGSCKIKIKTDLIDCINVDFEYNGKFKINDYSIKMNKGVFIKNKITKEKIEEYLNK